MTNKKSGNDWEKECLKLLGDNGFFATKLQEKNIPVEYHCAKRLEKADYTKYDYFICMEQRNIQNALRIFEKDPNDKIFRLISNKDIADPWYTDNFEETYTDIEEGLNKLIDKLKREY